MAVVALMERAMFLAYTKHECCEVVLTQATAFHTRCSFEGWILFECQNKHHNLELVFLLMTKVEWSQSMGQFTFSHHLEALIEGCKVFGKRMNIVT